MCLWAAAACLISAGASAQSRGTGWEFGADVVYQNSQDIDFDGGTTVAFGSDVGISAFAGYRFNDRLEVQFGLDWSTVDYDATRVREEPPLATVTASGDMETIAPFIKGNFNFMTGPITPFVSAGLGYSFIDTNIPDAPPQVGCWWDPWYGEICTTYQSTKTTEAFTYNAGVGVRWDVSTGYSLRLLYEMHWYDLDHASSAEFDQIKLGVLMRY